jgi:hypothetical protein
MQLSSFLLNFAGILFEIAFGLFGMITGDFAGGFFYCTFDFMFGAFNAIFVHHFLLHRWIATGSGIRTQAFHGRETKGVLPITKLSYAMKLLLLRKRVNEAGQRLRSHTNLDFTSQPLIFHLVCCEER